MNFDFYPSNVNFGDPNTEPSNPVGTPALNIPQLPTANQSVNTTNNSNKNYNVTFSQKISNFFNKKTGTILTLAVGIAIGFALKDLIASAVTNVLQPLVFYIISITHLNNFYDFTSFISPEKNALNVSTFISSLFSFVFAVITAYYINLLISTQL